jgi:hypothetical protein
MNWKKRLKQMKKEIAPEAVKAIKEMVKEPPKGAATPAAPRATPEIAIRATGAIGAIGASLATYNRTKLLPKNTNTAYIFKSGPPAVDEAILQRVKKAFEACGGYDKLKERCLADKQTLFASMQQTWITKNSDVHAVTVRDNATVLAVAHCDSVANVRTQFGIVELVEETLVFSPQLDDRLGVFTILDMLPALGIDVDILLTDNEESGASTAKDFTTTKKYNWMVEFDRRGENAVCYQYKDMHKLAEPFFDVQYGSVSDISLMSSLGVLGINVGVGYESEHTNRCLCVLEVYLRQIARFVAFYKTYADQHLAYKPEVITPFMGFHNACGAQGWGAQGWGAQGYEYGRGYAYDAMGMYYDPTEAADPADTPIVPATPATPATPTQTPGAALLKQFHGSAFGGGDKGRGAGTDISLDRCPDCGMLVLKSLKNCPYCNTSMDDYRASLYWPTTRCRWCQQPIDRIDAKDNFRLKYRSDEWTCAYCMSPDDAARLIEMDESDDFYCNLCGHRLSDNDILDNEKCGIEPDNWICEACSMGPGHEDAAGQTDTVKQATAERSMISD